MSKEIIELRPSIASREGSFDLLSTAIEAIVDGRPIPDNFVANLKEVLSNSSKKFSLIEALMANHQVHRLKRLLSVIERIEKNMDSEDSMFSMVSTQDPAFALEALKVLYKELEAVQESIKKNRNIAGFESVSSLEQAKISEQEERIQRIAPAERQKLRDTLEKVKWKMGINKKTDAPSS